MGNIFGKPSILNLGITMKTKLNDFFYEGGNEELVDYNNKVIENIESSVETLHNNYPPNLNDQQRCKLNKMFMGIIKNASIDYKNQGIQHIQTAVHTMLERVVTRVNERGIFKISRIQPCGSMAEQTTIWKCQNKNGEIYTEFDFLAVLGASQEAMVDQDCAGCVEVGKLPVDIKALRTYYNENEDLRIDTYVNTKQFDLMF